MRVKEKVCANCHQTFKPSSNHRHCPKCRNLLHRNTCSQCGKDINSRSTYCNACSNKLFPRTKTLEYKAASFALNKARSKKQVVNLRPEDLVELLRAQNGRCVYTGLPLSLPTTKQSCADRRLCASLDRIDSSLPYQIGNVQWVIMPIN